jgi:hypothetical protein
MDNCSAHVTDDVIPLLTEARVCVITFAPHTTQILQILGLTLFGVLKRRTGFGLPFENDNATVKFIMRVYHDFGQTIIQPNLWRAFQALGFEFDPSAEPSGFLFNEKKLRESARFRELWSLDSPILFGIDRYILLCPRLKQWQ